MKSKQQLLLQQLNPLISSNHWPVLEEYLGLVIDQYRTSLEGASSFEEVRELQGRIQALKSVRSLPQTILAMKQG